MSSALLAAAMVRPAHLPSSVTVLMSTPRDHLAAAEGARPGHPHHVDHLVEAEGDHVVVVHAAIAAPRVVHHLHVGHVVLHVAVHPGRGWRVHIVAAVLLVRARVGVPVHDDSFLKTPPLH